MEEKDLNIENSSNGDENDLSKIENQENIASSIFDEQSFDAEINEEILSNNEEKQQEFEEVADLQEEPIEEKIEELPQEEISSISEIQNEIDNIQQEVVEDIEDVSEEIPENKEINNIQIKKEETKNIEIAPILSDEDEFEEPIKELITVRPVKFQQFEESEPNRAIKKNLDILQDISMHVSVELGRTKTSIREVMEMEAGSIVELDKIAGEQVEIFVNEKLVARGEVIVIEDKFGVRITSTSITNPNQNY